MSPAEKDRQAEDEFGTLGKVAKLAGRTDGPLAPPGTGAPKRPSTGGDGDPATKKPKLSGSDDDDDEDDPQGLQQLPEEQYLQQHTNPPQQSAQSTQFSAGSVARAPIMTSATSQETRNVVFDENGNPVYASQVVGMRPLTEQRMAANAEQIASYSALTGISESSIMFGENRTGDFRESGFNEPYNINAAVEVAEGIHKAFTGARPYASGGITNAERERLGGGGEPGGMTRAERERLGPGAAGPLGGGVTGGESRVFSQSHLRPISSTPTHLSM